MFITVSGIKKKYGDSSDVDQECTISFELSDVKFSFGSRTRTEIHFKKDFFYISDTRLIPPFYFITTNPSDIQTLENLINESKNNAT
jgi:hypothetical protein